MSGYVSSGSKFGDVVIEVGTEPGEYVKEHGLAVVDENELGGASSGENGVFEIAREVEMSDWCLARSLKQVLVAGNWVLQ